MLALAVVATGGAVATSALARATGASAAPAWILALLGGVVLVGESARATARRRGELALARLRGQGTGRLLGFGAAPLVVLVVVGVALGLGLGELAARAQGRRWHVRTHVAGADVLIAVAFGLGALVAILVVVLAASRKPLVSSLVTRERRPVPSLGVRFLQVLSVVAAVVAVYEATRSGGHPWIALTASAVTGLAAGQLVLWALALVPPSGTALPAYLLTRRVRREGASTDVLRVVIAVGVVVAVAAAGARAGSDWRDDAARLVNGGPVAYELGDDSALSAYSSALDADPEGRWLMPVVAVTDERPDHRRLLVAADRWDRVVGEFYAGTGAAAIGPALGPLTDVQRVRLARGDAARITTSGTAPARLHVDYLDDRSYPRHVTFPLNRAGTARATLSGCHLGCSVRDVTVVGRIPSPVLVSRLVVGGVDLVHDASPRTGRGFAVTRDERGLTFSVTRTTTDPLVSLADPRPVPVLTTPGVQLPDARTVDGADGTARRVDVVGQTPVLPVLGTRGVLLDLGQDLAGAVGTVPAAQAWVVARADTPQAVLDRLTHGRELGAPVPYLHERDRLADTAAARTSYLQDWVAVLAALIGLLHVCGEALGQRTRRRTEAAALRVAGVRPRDVRRATAVEAGFLGLVAAVGTALAAGLLTPLLLGPIDLAQGWTDGPSPDLSTPWALVLGVALAAGVACAVVLLGVLGRAVRSAVPAVLREDLR